MGLTFRYNESTMKKALDNMAEKAGATILLYMATKATMVESEMKTGRPWQDQTNQAKAGLNVRVTQPNSNTLRMTLAHSAPHGVFLELAKEKRFAIIAPTLKKYQYEVIEDLDGIMKKMMVR